MAQITDPFVLPADVRLVPVATLPEDVRRHLEWVDGDVAIARLRSRTASQVIDAQTAALVEQFRSPKKMVEAVVRYCLASGADPRETLQDAFPVLQQLIAIGLLVPADSTAAQPMDFTLRRGDCVDGFEVVYPVHILQDVELYQARTPEGATVALKIARPDVGPGIARMLARESAILRLLDGAPSPGVAGTGEYEGRQYLAMDWCPGVQSAAAADQLRREGGPDARAAQLRLCESILRAYAALHAKGVVHGDVHPNNILVDDRGRARLVDFGLARVADPAPGIREPCRGGIALFYEPEYAEAARVGENVPAASLAGEQYGLAVLLYHLLTGVHYLDFSLEQDEMLRQIAEDPPLPFAGQGLEPWPAVEQALGRALRKDPAERYEDVAAFADELGHVVASLDPGARAPSGDVPAPPRVDSIASALRDNVLARVAPGGSVFVDGLPKPPIASINVGAAGIAYVLYRAACLRSDPGLLALADVWASRAAHSITDEAGFYNPDIEVTPETVGRITPYHTPSGVFAVQTLIARARGDRIGEETGAHAFVAAARQPCEILDLVLGKSSLLIAGALLCDVFSDRGLAERSGLLELGNTTMEQVWETLDRYPPITDASELTNLGMAHGWGGMIYAALRWCQSTGATPPARVEERLRQLAALAEPTGRGVRWLWQLDQPRLYMPGWCNGSAGYVYLWTLAHAFIQDPAFLRLAEGAAWNCWEDPALIGSLCCGLTGRAYALLLWYKETREVVWLRRAVTLANSAAANILAYQPEEEKGYENSLSKGELGVAALIIDLEDPERAALPFFESEGWSTQDLLPGKVKTTRTAERHELPEGEFD